MLPAHSPLARTTAPVMIGCLDALIAAAFLAITLWMGLRLKDKTCDSAGYLLGGRALTLPAFIATTVSTWYGGILGVGEYAYLYGISNWIVFGVPYYLGALLFALLLSKRARKHESLTIPHLFETGYGSKAAKCAAILIFLTTIPGAYTLMMGTLFSMTFDIPAAIGILLTAVFVVVYLWRGGFKAVVKTDAIQCALMFGGFLLLTLWLIIGFGLEPLKSLPPGHLEPTGGQPIASILVWYVIALSTLAEPNFFQRAFAAKTPEIAKKGLLISIACWCFFDIMTTICGLYARALLPDLSNPVQAFPALAANVLPIGLIGFFFAGLFATVLSSLDSNLFTAATTFGRDLCKNSPVQSSHSFKTKIGLILGAILASAIALCSGSVIEIWKIFGSVSAASLLIPILGIYYPNIKMSETGALILMITSCITTLIWFAGCKISGAFWLGMEPLFAGGLMSIFIFFAEKCLLFCPLTKIMHKKCEK